MYNGDFVAGPNPESQNKTKTNLFEEKRTYLEN
jgi:hypothetical protein